MEWNPKQYRQFESERTQPSVDLLNRLTVVPRSALDIGCGPGNSTRQLQHRFPEAAVLGVDASDAMLAQAQATYPHLRFDKCILPNDLAALDCFDLIFSNACLHWVPDHEQLLPALLNKLHPNGVLAVQMPLTGQAEFYHILSHMVALPRWHHLQGLSLFHNRTPEETYNLLVAAGAEVSMWETTYYHRCPSHNSVIEWYKGSGLRPYLDALDADSRQEFLDELLKIIKEQYPVQADGCVLLKMPRLFFTATRTAH